ncbi:MAG: 4Fe-4S binding protein [Firmicutes bacterium]|nr:4Fe-4S binding protein [Bacillota bacterium]
MKKNFYLTLFLGLILMLVVCSVYAIGATSPVSLLALESTATSQPDPDLPTSATEDSAVAATPDTFPLQTRRSGDNNLSNTNRIMANTVRTTPSVTPVETIPASGESFQPGEGGPEYPAGRYNPFQEHLTFDMIFEIVQNWWSKITPDIKVWYIFFALALTLYLFKLKQFRRPLLFLSILFAGFYLAWNYNPISAVFGLLTREKPVIFQTIIILAVPIFFSLLWGRIFCGWICPWGAVQEFLRPDQNNRLLPMAVDRFLKYLKYLILITVAYLTWKNGQNFWNNYDPAQTLFTFQGSFQAGLILTGILLLSAFISRPFCKYLCPLGALLAVISKIAPFKMRADASKCLVCGKCVDGQCPMEAISAFNIGVDLPQVSSLECIKCYRCQKDCRQTALRVTGFHIDRVYPSAPSKGANEKL